MEHKFTVLIDGGYYYDNEEEEFDISLTDEDMTTLRKLVSEYDGELAKGLMPILKAGAPELHQRFFDVIYPRVFLELFDLDRVDPDLDPDSADWHRQWDFDRDIDYMLATYGDAVDLSDAFICRIPDQFIQKTH